MDLAVEPVTFVDAPIAPHKIALSLHLIVLESSLIVSAVSECIATMAMLCAIFKVALVESPIMVLLTTLAL